MLKYTRPADAHMDGNIHPHVYAQSKSRSMFGPATVCTPTLIAVFAALAALGSCVALRDRHFSAHIISRYPVIVQNGIG
jgi:hypothetical protein